MGVPRAGEAKRPFVPRLEIRIKNQIFLERPEVGIIIPINWFDSCNESFFRHETHTTQESGSQLQCHAVRSLQVIHVPFFGCRGELRKLRADFSTVGLYCVTTT